MNKLISICLTIALFQCTSKTEHVTSETPPNILIFLVDDLGKEWVSCYGAEDIQTPNVDKLAKEGMLFHNVYSMPQCTPSRLTLLTGQYPYRHGWVNHWDVPRWGGGAHYDEQMNPSLGKMMKQAGYKTAVAGKWQVSDFRVQPDAMQKHGFDEYCMWTGYETGVEASAERYWNPYLHTASGSKTYEGAFGPDIFKDFLIDFIHNNKDTAMFIYFPMVLTHTPLVNTPDASADDNLGKHKAMVRYTDKITGEVVQALENAGIRENTIIIWTTDNGTTRSITGTLNGWKVKGAKAQTTEPGICAPFIVSRPGTIPSNVTSDALIDFSDIFPTCIDISGINFPSDHIIDGKSFKEVLTDENANSDRNWILSMGGQNNARLTENGVENQYKFRDRVIRNQRFKLNIDTNRKAIKFYDLKHDPAEESNLIDNLSNDTLKSNFLELQKVISTFPPKDNDPIYQPLPNQPWDVEITAESEVWKQ